MGRTRDVALGISRFVGPKPNTPTITTTTGGEINLGAGLRFRPRLISRQPSRPTSVCAICKIAGCGSTTMIYPDMSQT